MVSLHLMGLCARRYVLVDQGNYGNFSLNRKSDLPRVSAATTLVTKQEQAEDELP